jgi:hypothetical protein
MRAWLLHVVFAAILVGSLATKYRNTDLLVEDSKLEAMVIRIARAYGLAFRDYETIGDTDIRALVFEVPRCARPVLVVLLSVALDQERVVRSAREPGYVLRYVYMDRIWDKPHRLAVVAERAKHAALAVFGLTRYMPSWHLLLVESPADCGLVDGIDWQMVWSRDYLGR